MNKSTYFFRFMKNIRNKKGRAAIPDNPSVRFLALVSEIRIDCLPLCHRRDDAEVYDLVAHLAEMCV